jgi:hypothetical protein
MAERDGGHVGRFSRRELVKRAGVGATPVEGEGR